MQILKRHISLTGAADNFCQDVLVNTALLWLTIYTTLQPTGT